MNKSKEKITEAQLYIINKEIYTHTLEDIKNLEKNKNIKVALVGQEEKNNVKYAIFDVLIKKVSKFTFFKSDQSTANFEKIGTIHLKATELV